MIKLIFNQQYNKMLRIRVSDIPSIFGCFGQEYQQQVIECIKNGKDPNFKKTDFTKEENIFVDVLKNVNVNQMNEILNNKETLNVIKDYNELPKEIVEKIEHVNKSNDTVLNKHKEINKILESNGYINERRQNMISNVNIDKDLKEKVYMERGNKYEKNGLLMFSKMINKNIRQGTWNDFIKTNIDNTIELRGKLDGIIDDDIVVEHKERTSEKTHQIGKKEEYQLLGYCLLYDKHKGYIVSTYNNSQIYRYYEFNEETLSMFREKLINHLYQ
jgi:hypothetical protein